MAAGDRNVLAFANRNSLQHKQTRAYGAGAVCIKDGLFYETNDNIPEGTAFVEGTTGQTWKLVGSKPIDDWVASTDYKVGDQVFSKGTLWECKTAHTSATTFANTNWTPKAYGLDPEEWTYGTDTYTKSQTTTTYNTLHPVTSYNWGIGSESKPIYLLSTEAAIFSDGTELIGQIDADADHLGIYGESKPVRIGIASNTPILEVKSGGVDINETLTMQNGKGVIFEDTDTSGKEAWDVSLSGNELAFSYQNDGAAFVGVMQLKGDRLIPLNNTSTTNRFLGQNSTGNKWTKLYAEEASVIGSDRRFKNDIEDLPTELLDVWFDYVKPKNYLLKSSTSGRKHCGVIAQDVIAAFDASGLNWQEWDVVIEDDDGFYTVTYDHVQIIEMAAIRHKLGL